LTATDRRPPFRFAHRTRVGFDETDAQCVVYYGRYMPYFDRARVEYLRFLGLLHQRGDDADFVIRAQAVEYHAPAQFDDELEVFVRVQRIGTTSVGWEFAAYNAATGERLSTATQAMVHIALPARRPHPIGERYRSIIRQFEQELPE
jgi:acyl-CoA thioester hydrolase